MSNLLFAVVGVRWTLHRSGWYVIYTWIDKRHGYESGFVEWSLSICVCPLLQCYSDAKDIRLDCGQDSGCRECFVYQECISNSASEVHHVSGQTTILILPCIVRRPVDSRVEIRLWWLEMRIQSRNRISRKRQSKCKRGYCLFSPCTKDCRDIAIDRWPIPRYKGVIGYRNVQLRFYGPGHQDSVT